MGTSQRLYCATHSRDRKDTCPPSTRKCCRLFCRSLAGAIRTLKISMGTKPLLVRCYCIFFSTHNSNNCQGNVCILVWSDSTPISVSCKVLLAWRKSSCCAACGLWQHMLEAVLGFQGQYKYWAVAGGAGNHRPHFCLWLHLSSKTS